MDVIEPVELLARTSVPWSTTPMHENIQIGFQAFVSDSPEVFGAIRALAPAKKEVTVYVENAGEFVVPADAIMSVQSEKVTFDCKKLDARLRNAIGHSHDAEVPGL